MAPLPVRAVVRDPDLQRSRLTVFFRLLLAIPHLIWLGIWAFGALLLSPVMWIATLVRGTAPDGLHDFYERFLRYSVHVLGYVYLAANPFPGFLGDRGSYPVDIDVDPPEEHNRWTVGFRVFLAFPALFLAGALGAGITAGGARSFSFNIGVLAGVGFLAWFACLARGRLPQGFRDLMVYALHYEAQAYAYLFLLTPRYPNSNPALSPAADLPEHPIALSAAGDDLRRSRLTVFFRLLLVLPHLVWLLLWGIAVYLVAIIAWFAALFTARVPDGLHRFMAAYLRYQTHVSAFLYLAANPFPGFTGKPGSYPIELTVGPPERHSRWTVFFRGLLSFPALIVAAALSTAQWTVAVLAWFASLSTATIPEGLRNVQPFTIRYSAQLYSYWLLLTPRYPYSGPGPCDRPEPAAVAAPTAEAA